MKVGIIGTGWIAEKAAITLNGLDCCEAYAVGSRKQETADLFAAKWNIRKAYGSYSELIADKDIDLTNAITIILKDGILANVQSSAQCVGDNIGVIAGTEGNIIIDNINNPQMITVNGPNRTYVETIRVPRQITGYEYQFLACRQALLDGLPEPREMPHAETLYIMQLMDGLRRKWGVCYPMDEE